MLSIGPGIAFIVAAALLVGFVVLAVRVPVGRPPVRVGAGAAWAMVAGAGTLAVIGGVVEWRAASLAATETGGEELLASGLASAWWWVAVPAIVLGMAIVAVAARQALRRKVRGAAAWVGLALLAAVFLAQEATTRVWISAGDGRVHVRSGILVVRHRDFAAAVVAEVRLSSRYYRGAPLYSVRLAGPSLPDQLAMIEAGERDLHAARLEAARWARVGGWVVREEATEVQ